MKVERLPIILFPYDFTEVTRVAEEHAVGLAKLLGLEIRILNILDSGTRKYMRQNKLDRGGLEAEIKALSEKLSDQGSLKTSYRITSASIKKMCKIAEEEQVMFMILGIDEPKRAGASIMKVVARSPVPVMVVQQNASFRKFKKIFFPLDDFHGSRQKVGWTEFVASASGASVMIYSINPALLKQKEKIYHQKKVIEQSEVFFKKHSVECATEISTSDIKSFPEDCLRFAAEKECDLITIMHRPEKLFRKVAQIDKKLIFNDSKTPVLCINLRDLSVGGGIT